MKRTQKEYFLLWLMIASAIPFLSILWRIDFKLLVTSPEIFYSNTLTIIANLCGFLGALLFFWQILLGTRLFTRYLTPNTIWVNALHRKLGTYGIAFVLAHPLLEAYNYLQPITWLLNFSTQTEADTHISLGRIALIIFLTIWITSAVLRSKMKFKPWKYIHYASYPLMLIVFIHALDIGTFISTLPWLRIYWGSLLLAYLVIVIIRLLVGIAGLGKKNYRLAHIEPIGDSVIVLHLVPMEFSIKTPEIGQYAYLQLDAFRQAHPFTIMDCNEKTGELIFGIRKAGSFTRRLDTIKQGAKIRVDGPYGVFTREAQNTERRIVIAGGIGITPFVRLAKAYGDNMTLIACNRTMQDIVWRDELKSGPEKYIDVIEQASGQQDRDVVQGRLNADLLKQIVPHDDITTLPYFICGSPMFIKIMKGMLKDLGVPKQHIFNEELGFL